MKLYSFYASSSSYRVRIALHLKGLDFETVPINLRKGDGENYSSNYLQLNPQGKVPALIDKDVCITQSLAIIEYLEEVYPEISLLPRSSQDRAVVRAMALCIASDTQPLNSSSVSRYLRREFSQTDAAIQRWQRHWVETNFAALENQVETFGGSYCFSDNISLADIVLVPQVYKAKLLGIDLAHFPNLRDISNKVNSHPAFVAASPESQPDYIQ